MVTIKQHLGVCKTDCSINYNPFKIMTIKSQIIDFSTGQPIESVNVFYKNNPTIGVITNSNGVFQLDATPDEQIVFSHVAFQNEVYKASQIEAQEYLIPETNMLDEVVVVAKKKKNWILGALAAVGLIWLVSNGEEEEKKKTVKAKV